MSKQASKSTHTLTLLTIVINKEIIIIIIIIHFVPGQKVQRESSAHIVQNRWGTKDPLTLGRTYNRSTHPHPRPLPFTWASASVHLQHRVLIVSLAPTHKHEKIEQYNV
jgi:hypothetical protein